MRVSAIFRILFFALLCIAEAKDLYKILGVDKSASQRDIQKAFHKLSLKYHPDKNKSKDAQAKFSEINNAYETLSDEEKRKNYDMFGDPQGNPGFQGGNSRGAGFGSDQFNFGGQNGRRFTFGQEKYQRGAQGQNFKSYNFPFEKTSEGGSSFSFDFGSGSMGDIFSSFFGSGNMGQKQGKPFGGYGSSKGAQSSHWENQENRAPNPIQSLDSRSFKSKVTNQGLTWLLMFYSSSSGGQEELEGILRKLSQSFQNLVKVGTIDCQQQQKLCKEQNVWPLRKPKIYVYSIRHDGKGSLLEYTGDWKTKDIKDFCSDLLPKVTKKIDSNDVDDLVQASAKLPRALLLTTKKQTPAVWRVLSGSYRNRVLFYDVEVPSLDNPVAKKFGVKALPAILGILSNGEVLLLSGGTKHEQTGSPKIEELSKLIETLEKKNPKASTTKASSQQNQGVNLLSKESEEELCSEKIPLCVIGAFKTSQGKGNLKKFLSVISQKTLTRGRRQFEEVKDPVSYSLVDATKQKAFLQAFDKSGFKGMDTFLIVYKPKKGRFAIYSKPVTLEEAEKFVSGALNGDVHFSKVLQKPVLS